MSKRVLVLLMIAIPLLSSCFKVRSAKDMINQRLDMLNKSNDDEIAYNRMELILKAIKSKDKDALKAMFSKKALSEAKDMDGGIDYIFDFFKGEVVKWEGNGPIVDEDWEYGHIIKELKSFFSVDTDKQKYLVFFLEYTVDTDHPDNVGLYSLRIIKSEDEKTQFGYWTDMMIAGIYHPATPRAILN